MSVTVQFKDTWWNKLRVERNITYKDLGHYLDLSYSTVGAWFSGQILPDRSYIYSLCDLFDVDYHEGEQHFIEDNAKWKSEREHGNALQSVGAPEEETLRKRSNTKTTNNPKVENKKEEIKAKEVLPMSIFEIVYGKIPYKLFVRFTELVANKEGDPMSIIYGQVTYTEFRQIEEVLNGVYENV